MKSRPARRKASKAVLFAPLGLLLFAGMPALAQSMPDAGRVLQENAPVLEAPRASGATPSYDQPAAALPQEGGPEIELDGVQVNGNTIFTDAQLRKVIGPVAGKKYDYTALRGISDRLSHFYHEQGYPFARVFLPPQVLENGLLTFDVVEGRYGKIAMEGPANLTDPAKAFLSGLHTGDVIESDALERTTLVLDDMPDIKVAPVIRPGEELGTGDLNVVVAPTPLVTGELGFDNNGNRYNGAYRGKMDLQVNGPFQLGDQIALKSMVSDENLWLGSLAYSAPLNSSGLRGVVSFMQTDYELGKQFEALDASGYAKIYSAGLSFPALRTQRANVNLSGTLQHKDLTDKQGAAGSESTKTSDGAVFATSFDRRDGLLGGGVTYGQLSWTTGSLALDAASLATDRITARTKGSYDKINMDLARIQALPESFSLFGRVSGQESFKNLDSSEGFGLGGPSGVRAYPVGEGYGDIGWLTQIELRYTYGAVTPFAFYDAGWVKVNESAWDNGKNERNLSGAGIGLRAYYLGFKVETSLAWAVEGGDAESDTLQRDPRAWFTLGYAF